MYLVLDKDTINKEIVPFIPVPKRGFRTQCDIVWIVNCILHKLKTGCQWYILPVESLFSEVVLHYKTVFGYFRKWCKSGLLKQIWFGLLDTYRASLNMSSVDLDGSHTTALRGGEQVCLSGSKEKEDYQCSLSYRQAGYPFGNVRPDRRKSQ